MPRQLTPAAQSLLRHARNVYPRRMRVAGLGDRAAVRELVEHNLVVESDVDEASTGYNAQIRALPWERR